MTLNARQTRFVAEYLVDLNATQAAIRAGYSVTRARFTGSDLVTNRNVAAAIAERQQTIAQKLDVSAERVVAEYARLGFAKLSDAVSWSEDNMVLVPSDELDADTSAAVKAVRVTKTITRQKDGGEQEQTALRIEMHDKKGALDSLSRHLGLFKDAGDGAELVERVIFERRTKALT